jgi:hypothetical protein
MATQAQLERLIGRALTDPAFRTLLLQDPQAGARQLRYKLDDLQIERIKQVDPSAADRIAAEVVEALSSGPHHPIGFW